MGDKISIPWQILAAFPPVMPFSLSTMVYGCTKAADKIDYRCVWRISPNKRDVVQHHPLATQEQACYIKLMILLSRVDPAENVNRWYLVSIQPTLFHPCAVVVAWGRRDNEFQRWRAIPVENQAQANQLAERIVSRKIKRGYRVLESVFL